MKCGKTVRSRAVRLKVVEVAKMVESLQNAETMTHLDGWQRQLLDDAIGRLMRAKDRPVGEEVEVSVETAVMVMRCVAMTQQWFESMLQEFGRVELD
jgi:hypothetical protein